MLRYRTDMLSIALAVSSAATGVLAVALAVNARIEQRAEKYELDRLIWVPVSQADRLG